MYREPIADRERFDAVRRSDQLHSMNLNEGLYRSTVCICTLSIYTIGEGVKSKRRRRPIDRIQSFLYSHRSILQFYTYSDREMCSFGCKKSAWTEFFFFLSGRKKGKKKFGSIHVTSIHSIARLDNKELQNAAGIISHWFLPSGLRRVILRSSSQLPSVCCVVVKFTAKTKKKKEKRKMGFSILLMD